MNEILIIFLSISLLTGGSYFDDLSTISLGIFDVFADLKLPKIINIDREIIAIYDNVEGNMVMRVYNSESQLVSFVYSEKISIRKNPVIKQYINDYWTLEETITKNGKNYNVFTFIHKLTTEKDMETLGFFVLYKTDESSSLPQLKIKNPQINIVPGDVVIYEIRILQPVL